MFNSFKHIRGNICNILSYTWISKNHFFQFRRIISEITTLAEFKREALVKGNIIITLSKKAKQNSSRLLRSLPHFHQTCFNIYFVIDISANLFCECKFRGNSYESFLLTKRLQSKTFFKEKSKWIFPFILCVFVFFW